VDGLVVSGNGQWSIADGAVRAALPDHQVQDELVKDSPREVIQFIAGDRGGAPRDVLQIPREDKGIRNAVGGGLFREAFGFAPSVHAASINDVISCRYYRPTIIHFVGHGSERRLLLVRDRDLLVEMTPLDLKQAETLFSNFPARVRLVVFNTCRSLELARYLTAHDVVDMAVGVEGLISDDKAIEFALTFYRLLADGENVQRAFDLAGLHLGAADAAARPQLFASATIDPRSFVFGRKSGGHDRAP
jgi:hypothetical protein